MKLGNQATNIHGADYMIIVLDQFQNKMTFVLNSLRKYNYILKQLLSLLRIIPIMFPIYKYRFYANMKYVRFYRWLFVVRSIHLHQSVRWAFLSIVRITRISKYEMPGWWQCWHQLTHVYPPIIPLWTQLNIRWNDQTTMYNVLRLHMLYYVIEHIRMILHFHIKHQWVTYTCRYIKSHKDYV